MLKELCVLVVCFMTVSAFVRTQCKQDTECAADECCYYHEGPMIFSKKRNVLPVFQIQGMVQGGWCEKYKQQGDRCSGIAKMNGHCECAPGLKCTWIKDPTLPPLQTVQPVLHAINARMVIGGGHSECLPAP